LLLFYSLFGPAGTPRSGARGEGDSGGNGLRDTIVSPVMPGGEGVVVPRDADPPPAVNEDVPPTRYADFLSRKNTPAPPLPEASNVCHLPVEIRGYAGQDGCDLLLETDAGNLFFVGAEHRGDPLEPGTRISIGFEYMEADPANACTNVDATIRITCWKLLRVSSGIPRPIVCEAYDRPSQCGDGQ
jgi:hypothetical protein